MRILELTAHVQAISRAQGRSATAAAAYRACERIACERENRVHDYRDKQGLEAAAIVVPDNAPAWSQSRSSLWNGAELRERNGTRGANAGAFKAKATVAREILFGFPAELSPAGRLALARQVARHLVETHGVAVDFSIHQPGKLGDQRNHHCHMMYTTRRMTAAGLTDKTREWDGHHAGRRTVTAFRAWLAGAMNAALAAEGHGGSVHVEHRSLKTRGSSRTPTRRQPLGRINADRERQFRERQTWERQTRQKQAERHGRERTEQTTRHEASAAARHRDIDAREQRAIDQARAEAAARAPAPPPPAGALTRLFRAITGRQEQAPAPNPPSRELDQRISDMRAAFQAERHKVGADHTREAHTLDDRQRADDRQLDQAAAHRVDRDRIAEVQARRDLTDGRDRDRTHERPDDRERQFKP